MITQYLYISTAPALSRDAVDSIIASSARNNPERGVTGLLVYNGRNFLQLLEGEEVELSDLMATISKDPRHTGLSMLVQHTVDKRSCPDWAMKRVLIVESHDKRREALEAAMPPGLNDQVREIVRNFALLN